MSHSPQVLTQQKHHSKSFSPLISYILPSVICKILNNAIILINIWWSRTHQILLMGMGVATVFSFTFGYLIIISLNTGLAYQISRKRNKPQKIGIFYQRALIINFVICFLTITPLLYASKKSIYLFQHIDLQTSHIIGQYLFQLLPSIYCFAYFDTTQTFLQTQGHILAPLIIQIISVFMHLYLINHVGAAWSRNFTDLFCCVAVYLYIILLDKPLKSWIQWTMKCIKGWGTHIKFLEVIGLSTYLEIFFFFIFSIICALQVNKKQLVCHICFINLMQIIYLALLGIKVGGLSKIGFKMKQNKFQSIKAQSIQNIKIIFGTGLVFTMFIYIYRRQVKYFFIYGNSSDEIFKSTYPMLILTILLTSAQASISSLVKSLERNFSVLKLNIFSYVLGIILANLLSYNLQNGLTDQWLGWNLGIVFNSACCIVYLYRKYKDFFMINTNTTEYNNNMIIRINNHKQNQINDKSIELQQIKYMNTSELYNQPNSNSQIQQERKI